MQDMKRVQQLLYDGKKLSCPDHPDHPIEKGTTLNDKRTFTKVCMAPTSGKGVCMNSAEWESEEAMNAELDRLASEPD
jgi:hypothetical protein